MHSSPYPPLPLSPPPSPPLPYAGISTLILIYIIIAYVVVDFINENEGNGLGFADIKVSPLELSVRDIEAALPWFENEADTNIGCVICLDWLQKGEKCRRLPVCSHVFHADCIELWLVKRLSCPICRSPLTVNGLEAV